MDVERIFDRTSYPIRVDHGRDIGAGYLRGWGLEFGGLLEDRIARDPIFHGAMEYATRRGTLVTRQKLANLFLILRYGWGSLEGDIFEFGSYRGGSAAFIAYVVRALGRSSKVYALDTFDGLPTTDPMRDLHSAGDFRDADLPGFRDFIRKEKLEDRIAPVKGLFEHTLPGLLQSKPSMALVHIDCDLYEPIKYLIATCDACCEQGSYVVFDDPLFSSCIGAFDAMAEGFVRERVLLPEQVYPHLVFRPKGAATHR